jgi:hypothetical protein
MERHSGAFFNQSNNLCAFIATLCSMDIPLYTGDCGAKTEQKIDAAIGSIVVLRLKNRAERQGRIALAFGICVRKNQNRIYDVRTANRPTAFLYCRAFCRTKWMGRISSASFAASCARMLNKPFD